MQVQQVSNDDFEEKRVFVAPILHVSCSKEVEHKTPASIRIPITLPQEKSEQQSKLENLSSSHIRVCSRRDESQEWDEITGQSEPPPKLENGVVAFQVDNISR